MGVQQAIEAVQRARQQLTLGRPADSERDQDYEADVYRDLSEGLRRALGRDVGLSADFVNSTYILRTSPAGLWAPGSLFLFEEDDWGAFSVLERARGEICGRCDGVGCGRCDDGMIETEDGPYIVLGEGRVRDGSLERLLRRFLPRVKIGTHRPSDETLAVLEDVRASEPATYKRAVAMLPAAERRWLHLHWGPHGQSRPKTSTVRHRR